MATHQRATTVATPPVVTVATRPVATMIDPRSPQEQRARCAIIAFYYPGMATPWDEYCGAGFLGNFYPSELEFSPPCGKHKITFSNAEAAFQACKFWDVAQEFAALSGQEAFNLKRSSALRGHEDWTYGGFGDGKRGSGANWRAMHAVLSAKFRRGSPQAMALVGTKGAFLLEHNAVVGRDAIWSDNGDGTGANWLGALLMIIRDDLSNDGHMEASWTALIAESLDLDTGATLGPAWHQSVRVAREATVSALGT